MEEETPDNYLWTDRVRMFQLELCTRVGDEYDHTGEEETIATSNSIEALEEVAKKYRLKGNKHLDMQLRIIEEDEYGDIHYIKFLEIKK